MGAIRSFHRSHGGRLARRRVRVTPPHRRAYRSKRLNEAWLSFLNEAGTNALDDSLECHIARRLRFVTMRDAKYAKFMRERTEAWGTFLGAVPL